VHIVVVVISVDCCSSCSSNSSCCCHYHSRGDLQIDTVTATNHDNDGHKQRRPQTMMATNADDTFNVSYSINIHYGKKNTITYQDIFV